MDAKALAAAEEKILDGRTKENPGFIRDGILRGYLKNYCKVKHKDARLRRLFLLSKRIVTSPRASVSVRYKRHLIR